MGCDIHIYIERKGSDGIWYNSDYFVPIPVTSKWTKYERIPIMPYRSYPLFALLANVRNYENIPYINEPKGLPEDLSAYVQNEWEWWASDAHSASYFTLLELVKTQKDLICDEYCQDQEDLAWSIAVDRFNELVDEIKKRVDAMSIIYDFEWASLSAETRRKAAEKASKIRIVFWFDN